MDILSFAPAATALAAALRQRGWRLASAESCTGGLIAAACTALAGSSDWFERGFVTYSNAAKTEMLGVDAALIAAHGAVSEAVALAMADGIRARAASEIGIGVSGVVTFTATAEGARVVIVNLVGQSFVATVDVTPVGQISIIETREFNAPLVGNHYFYRPVTLNTRVDEAQQVDTLNMYNGPDGFFGSLRAKGLRHLTLTSGARLTLGSAVDIYETLKLTNATLDLNYKSLTLRSTPATTARIDDLTGSTLSNATNVTVERYIPNTGRRWRLLTAPLNNLTINTAWQNGQKWNGVTLLNGSDSGTLITGQTAENARLTQRNQRLEAEVVELRKGDSAVEERARADLGLIGPDETFYLFGGARPAG